MYRKPTNTGLLLHFHSHTDKRYKVSLLKTMLHLAYALSYTAVAFNTECGKLRLVFSRLDYPGGPINSQYYTTLLENREVRNANTVRVSLPLKDQVAANAVRKQLRDLSHKIGSVLTLVQPVFVRKKIGERA